MRLFGQSSHAVHQPGLMALPYRSVAARRIMERYYIRRAQAFGASRMTQSSAPSTVIGLVDPRRGVSLPAATLQPQICIDLLP
jgi:hypothetical protein